MTKLRLPMPLPLGFGCPYSLGTLLVAGLTRRRRKENMGAPRFLGSTSVCMPRSPTPVVASLYCC